MNVVYVLKRVNLPGEVIIRSREQSYTCGRGKENEIVCPSMLVSRRHCIFIIHSDGLYIRDLNSSNGVFVNGEKKRTDTKLNHNDIIGIGIPELNPQELASFVYCLQIQSSNNAEELRAEDAVVPPISIKVENNRSDPGHQEDPKIPEKKRPGEVNENIPPKKLKTEESCSNVGGRVLERATGIKAANPAPSTSFATGLPVDVNSIKADPDDDIQILEVISIVGQSALKVTAEKLTEVSNSNKLEAGPKKVVGKPIERCTEIFSKLEEKWTESNRKPSERRTELFSKSEQKRAEVVSNPSERRTEIFSKLEENRTEASSKVNEKRTEIFSKPEKECTEILGKSFVKHSEILNKSSERRTEISIKSSERGSGVSNKSSERLTEIFTKPAEKLTESIQTTAPQKNQMKEGKIVITSIRTIQPNDSFDFHNFREISVNKSLIHKTEMDTRRKSCDPKVTQCHNQPKEREFASKLNQSSPELNQSLSKPSSYIENHSRSTINNLNEENLQNSHLTNGYVPVLDNIKIKEEPTNVDTSITKDKKLDLSENNLQKKANGVLELKQNGYVSRDFLSDHNLKDCDKPVAKETSSKVNTSNKAEEAVETNYQSDDELFVVNVIINNDNFNYLEPPVEQFFKASTSPEVKLKPIKEEPKTSYSEIDVVSLSSDEEDDGNVFPCSQLFSSVNEEPVIKQNPTEEIENKVQEPQKEEDVIVLSDSDEEDNPWYHRLFNSQVYRPSQDFCVKIEPEDEVEQAVDVDESGLTSLFAEEKTEKEGTDDKSDLEISSRDLVPDVEEQDDDVWNENIQSQETAAQEAKFFEQQASEVLAETEKKIPESSFEKSHESKLIRPRSEQGTEKQPKKKIRKMNVIPTKRKEDIFEETEYIPESSAFEEVQKSIKTFEDFRARRKSSENELNRKSFQQKKKDEDSRKATKFCESEEESDFKNRREKQRESEDYRENRRFHVDDRERRKSSVDDQGRRKTSDEDRRSWTISMDGREKQRRSVEDRERRRGFDDNWGGRKNSDEIQVRRKDEVTQERRKEEAIQGKQRESEKSRDRRYDHEDTRERNKENQEKRAKGKQGETFEASKKKKEEEEHQAKRKEQNVVEEKKGRSEEDRKKLFEFEKKKVSEDLQQVKVCNDISHRDRTSCDDLHGAKICDGEPQKGTTNVFLKKLFENEPPKIKDFKLEVKKLDKMFANFTQRKSFTIPKIQHRNVSEVPLISKSIENISENLKLTEELPQTSKAVEVGPKRPKNWENILQSIDEKSFTIKAKQPQRRGPVVIQPPHMPKGERRGISVSVFKNNNDYTEASLSMEEELQNETPKSEPKKSISSGKTPRQRGKLRFHRSQENLSREFKDPVDEQKNKEIRKEKLKLITAKKPSLEKDTSVTNDRPRSKAIVKVTHKTRQDTLLFDQQKTVALKPGIAHQRMNNVQPVAHCSKSIPELIKVQRDKVSANKIEETSQKTEEESCYQVEERSSIFEEQEQEEMLNDLVSSELKPVSSGELEMNNTANDKILEDSKPADVKNKTEDTKKPRKSCLASFSFNCFREKSGRRVGFDMSRNEVREYEISGNNSLKRVVGKDAPINRPKPQFESKIDEYLSRIFTWNPSWLEEQKNLPHEPPVHKGDKLRPMKNYYASISDYCDILRPLLLLEIWNALSKESECDEKRKKYRMLYCSVVANSITKAKTSGGESQTNFMIEVLMSREDFEKDLYPGVGHLIILEYPNYREVKDSDGRVKKKSTFRRIFAYVDKKWHASVMSNTRYNRDLKRLTPNPEMLLTFSVLTKQGIEPPTDTTCRMRGVMYLKSNMREILALQHFPNSPLKRLILTPTIDDYQLPEVYSTEENPLATKDNLNSKQIEAVMRISEAALSDRPQINLIHGPPGTGKSKVIVNIVTQILSRFPNTKILVCAPSNAAVDELVLRLLQIRSSLNLKHIKMVRVGRPESMNPRVKNVSLTELGRKQVEKDHIFTEKEAQIQKENEANIQKLEKFVNLTEERMEDVRRNGIKGNISQLMKKRQDLQSQLKVLKAKIAKRVDLKKLNPAELNRMHRNTEELMLSKASVIACTLSSCYSGMMEKLFGGKNGLKIPICIVDEATQSCETENLIPLMLGVQKLILVGDTNQLPATVLSKTAKDMGLDQSLFARIQKTFEEKIENPIIMLNTQYRMDYPILSWPNTYFYKGKLIDKATVKVVPYSSYRVLNLNSYQDESRFSNTNEAEFVSKIIYIMVTCVDLSTFKEPLKIGVITPYQNQRDVILSKIEKRLYSVSSDRKNKFLIEVNTVDSFQGQERDVIIMSCVRSNGIGFMSDKQRLCVALTRAKSSLILCGNFKTFQKDEMWNELLTNARNRSVFIDVQISADLDEIRSHVLR